MVGGGLGRGAAAVGGKSQRSEERVAQLARFDHLVVAHRVGRRVRAAELGVLEQRLRVFLEAGRLPPPSAGIAPSRAPGSASVTVWASNGFIAMSDDPKP